MSELLDRLTAALSDRYALEGELGAGGMATVYAAQDLKHNRKVAVKVLHPELAAIIGAERFLKEIEVTANLQHPHILPLFDSGAADSFLYYVMPRVEGESLRDKLDREKQLSIEESIEITGAVASALDYAHRHGVIHRDIKPANILLHDGQPVVADLGIALALSAAGGRRLTETGLSVGTPEYMSPEQAAGDRSLDARCDVYSLGCVAYEMLLGQPPHTAATAQAVIAKVIVEEPRRISAERRTVPPHVEYAVHRALAKLPADRFASAAEFRDTLSNPNAAVAWPASVPLLAGDDTWTRFVVKNRWLRWVMPLSLVLLAGVAVWGWFRPTTQPPQSLAKFELAYEGGISWQGARHALAISHDGSYIAYVGGGETDQPLYLRPIDEIEATLLPGTEGALDPFFSPDGQWIGFATVTGLKKVAFSGGSPISVLEFAEPRGVAWDVDGSILFGSASGLWRLPPDGQAQERLTTPNADEGELLHSRPDILPGGRGVLFTIVSGNIEETQVAVLSLATGAVTPLFRGLTPRFTETGHIAYGRPDGVLMAVPFDPVGLLVEGTPVPLLDSVMVKATGTMDFAVSRTGVLVHLTGVAEGGTVVMVDRSGQEQPLIDEPAVFISPRLSPDGSRLALGIGSAPIRQIWIHEMESGTRTPLTFEGNNYYPVWDPNGDRVAYSSENTTSVDIMSMSSDGIGTPQLMVKSGLWNYPESWSSDGRHLIFREQDSTTQRDIWILSTEGELEARPFFQVPSDEDAPGLSPDGRWLAYASNMSGRYEIYVNSFPDPGRRIPVSLGGGTEPVWSRDGRELFYRNGSELVAVDVETTPNFSVRGRQVLFEGPYALWPYHSNYDVHPDGQRFVMIKPYEKNSSQLVVVLNWFEELRRMTEDERRRMSSKLNIGYRIFNIQSEVTPAQPPPHLAAGPTILAGCHRA